MYKIGDFSKKTNVPIKTLRYYDEIDLFKPLFIDECTGYRYYQDVQIKVINKIKMLKDLNLSLKEIHDYLESEDINILLNKEREFRMKVEKIANYVEDSKYEIKKGTYNDYIKWNGLRMANTPAALEIRDGVAKFYMVFKNEEYFSDFLVFEEEENLINLNIVFHFEDFIRVAIETLKNEYDYITFSIDDNLYHGADLVRNNCHVIEEREKEVKGYDGRKWELTYLKVSLDRTH